MPILPVSPGDGPSPFRLRLDITSFPKPGLPCFRFWTRYPLAHTMWNWILVLNTVFPTRLWAAQVWGLCLVLCYTSCPGGVPGTQWSLDKYLWNERMPGWLLRILNRCKEELQWTSNRCLKSNTAFNPLLSGQRPHRNGRSLLSWKVLLGFLSLQLENRLTGALSWRNS